MLTVLSVEVRKLNRSLALLLALAAPGLIALFGFLMMLQDHQGLVHNACCPSHPA